MRVIAVTSLNLTPQKTAALCLLAFGIETASRIRETLESSFLTANPTLVSIDAEYLSEVKIYASVIVWWMVVP